MTDADIKKAIQTIEIHHASGWWVAVIPDINIGTQAKTLPELGVEAERIIVSHFETAAALGTDPYRNKRLSLRETADRFAGFADKAIDGWSHAAKAFSLNADEAQIEDLRKELAGVR